MGFKGPLADSLVNAGFFDPASCVLDMGLRDDLVRDYGELMDIARAERPGYQYEMGAIVYRILSRLASNAERAEQHSRAEDLLVRARAFMESKVEAELDVQVLSRELGLSYENFRRIFQKYTGLAPYQYYNQLKMAHAKALLENHALSVKEIAYRLSFENQYYFSRIFKTHTGLSPLQWRTRRG